MKKIVFIFTLALSALAGSCSHIVGGELFYNCLGNNQYHFTLKLYRDCKCTNCADFGQVEYLTVFDASGNVIKQAALPFPGRDTLNPTFSNPCMTQPDVCVEQAAYTGIITLAPSTGGYDVVYQRCCRNNGVVNLVSGQGASFTAHVPDPGLATCNNSPRFNNLPPMYICVNAPLSVDYSATDPDGDQLVYSLCDPFDGANTNSNCPDPSPAAPSGCPTAPPPPPYTSINYASPYSASDFTNSPSNGSNLVINPQTGLLTGTPNGIGIYDVTVCVSEFRNGQLLGVLRRDFQFNVAQCNIPIAAVPEIGFNNGVGIYTINCKNLTVSFLNNTYNPPPVANAISYHWDFGVPGLTNDTSYQFEPTYTYPDSGAYTVKLTVFKDAGNGLTCVDSTIALVYLYPIFNTDFTATNVCVGTATSFLEQTNSTNSPNPTIWNWSFGDGTNDMVENPTHIYSTSGVFNATLIDFNNLGCSDTVQKSVTVYAPPAGNFSFSPPCINRLVNFSSTTAGTVSSYFWNLGAGGVTSTNQSTNYTYTTPGNYTVVLIVQSPQGCFDTVAKTFTLELPLTAAVQPTADACKGLPVQLHASGGLYYAWSPVKGLSDPNSSDPVALPDSATLYKVTVSNDCYSDTASVDVIIHPLPLVDAGSDTTIWRNTSAVLHGVTNETNHFWNPSTWLEDAFSLTTSATPPQTTWYELFAIDQYGCLNKDSILVTVESNTVLDIPTGFSPNGDGMNDVFHIVRYLNISHLKEFAVFNRWGEKVFSTENISKGWDGNVNGKPQPLGVYAWLVVAETSDGEEITRKGTITLVR